MQVDEKNQSAEDTKPAKTPRKPSARLQAASAAAEKATPASQSGKAAEAAPAPAPAASQAPRGPEQSHSAAQQGQDAGRRRLHDVRDVPHALRQEAQAKWGTSVEISASRENGRYTGPVFTSGDYLAQKVGERSVVVHQVGDVDFKTSDNMKRRADEKRLTDVNMQINYQGDKGQAHFHDPKRAAIEEMFSRIHRTAKETLGRDFEPFARDLDVVKTRMVEQYRESKQRQFDARTQSQAPQRGNEQQRGDRPAAHPER
ncbi:hypothetical protein EJP67_33045 [Variovorax guangxiensis]|uniref:Uncharacterized protein n=1 Tax=Variovorax guangxiensis TaxID=1775474 RepID=A0A433MVF6_9BURK|nr:hypothetical protein [Variovorax guangxiensis]RUR71885.1 hypothetical protein EJP67_33045 [Variovorax guangxiensis]